MRPILSSMKEKKVYVIQEIAGSTDGRPKINIMGAASYSTTNDFIFFTNLSLITSACFKSKKALSNKDFNRITSASGVLIFFIIFFFFLVDKITINHYIVKHERKNSLRHTRNSRYPIGQP